MTRNRFNGHSPGVQRALQSRKQPRRKYLLRLYVTGTTARSARAILNLRNFCEKHLQDRYQLEIIDVYQRPHLAKSEQIVAAPTLVKRLPKPLRRFIGDLSEIDNLLVALDLLPTSE